MLQIEDLAESYFSTADTPIYCRHEHIYVCATVQHSIPYESV